MSPNSTAPAFLDAIAREKWARMVEGQNYKEHQLDALAAYCAAYSRWCQAEKFLADPTKHVVTITNELGEVLKHCPAPHIEVSAKAQAEMAKRAKILRLARSF